MTDHSASSVRDEIYAELSEKTQDELLDMIKNDHIVPETVTQDGEIVNVDFNIIEEGNNYIIQIFAGGGFRARGSLDIVVPKQA